MQDQTFRRCLTTPYQLFRGPSAASPATVWTRLEQFRIEFECNEPFTLEWMGKINVKHRGPVVSYLGPVGVGLRATLRHSSTPIAPPPPFSFADSAYYNVCLPHLSWSGKAACNIASADDHYADLTTIGSEFRDAPGHYRLEFWGCSHSTGAPNTDGLACVNVNGDGSDAASPYSYLVAKVALAG